MTTTKEAIASLLAAQEPCTLRQIVEECAVQCDEKTSELMPLVVIAIAEMISDGTICGYGQEDEDLEDEFDYAWILSEDPAPLTSAELDSAREFADELINACQEPSPEVVSAKGYLHPTEGWQSA